MEREPYETTSNFIIGLLAVILIIGLCTVGAGLAVYVTSLVLGTSLGFGLCMLVGGVPGIIGGLHLITRISD